MIAGFICLNLQGSIDRKLGSINRTLCNLGECPAHVQLFAALLGSKILGTKYIRTSICNVLANHDQNLESRFGLLKVCLFVKLELSEL